MALRSPDVSVLAITAVAGNVAVQQAARNALYTAELCGANVPVFLGAEKPLQREHQSAHWFHGRDGLGDHGYPAPRRAPEKQHAVDAIVTTIDKNPGLVLVTLGPLTNIALALQRKPDIATKLSRCVIMGGAPCCEGNITPAAEYNIWCDPEAARIVLRSGLLVELVGWHLCRGEAVLKLDDIERVLSLDTPLSRFAIECNSRAQEAYFEQTGEHGISLPDPVAMSVALDPTIVTEQTQNYVDVETSSELTRGMTVVDRLHVARNERNRAVWAPALEKGVKAKVVWTIDNARWKKALFNALR
ncbi:MAG: nucleoside hydrolase [Acidobacteria bacterium 13_1_40CM_4_58_4]|nr:MAG: nucleoside hydrolase [Acidobacteria bacterium 13_1_40CM_4_58_4]